MIASILADLRKPQIWLWIEILAILSWTYMLAGHLLDFDAWKVLYGRDYFNNVQGNFFWEHLKSCGTCALWNGDLNGGAPALADPQSPLLHPVVILTTLAWGVINGAKITTFLALFFGGLGQLWIGHELGVGRLARLVPALIAVGAGHLVGPLEGGLVGMTLGFASIAFIVASILHLHNVPTTRSLAFLSVSLASLALTGQGYLQIAIAILAPSALLFVTGIHLRSLGHLLKWVLAGLLLAASLAAPLLVPILRAFPHITKDLDPYFKSSQDLQYVPLNLVIDNWDFYHMSSLGTQPFPYAYLTYVGWVVIGFALVGLSVLIRRDRRTGTFFGVAIISSFVLASREFWLFIYDHTAFSARLHEYVAGLRTITVVSKIAVIPILACMAIGIDGLLKWQSPWKRLNLKFSTLSSTRTLTLRLSLVPVVAVICMLALIDIRHFADQWLSELTEADRSAVEEVLLPLQSDELQWVEPIWGENWFLPFTVPLDLKIANQWRPWRIKDVTTPPPAVEITRGEPPAYAVDQIGTTSGGLPIYAATDEPAYASVNGEPGASPCTAHGEGGHINVSCEIAAPATIQVLELNLPGWHASVNGNDVNVESSGQWLGVPAPAGDVEITLRYRPTHVWIGFLLGIIGSIWAAVWIVRPTPLAIWQRPHIPNIQIVRIRDRS